MKAWNADAIQSVADDLAYVAQKFADAAKQMREKKLEELVLQADAAFGVYRSTFMKLAGDVETEFRDQLRAKQMGTVPRWKINQKVVEARRAAKAELKEKGLPSVKKATKKKST